MAKNPYFDEDDEDIVEESDGWVTSPFANITKPPEGKKRVVKKPVVEEPVEYFEEEEIEEDIAFSESEVSISEDDAEFFYNATTTTVPDSSAEVVEKSVRRQPVRKQQSKQVTPEPIIPEQVTPEPIIPEPIEEVDEEAAAEEYLRQKALERRLERERVSAVPSKPIENKSSDKYKWANEEHSFDEREDSFDSTAEDKDPSSSFGIGSDDEKEEEESAKRGFFGKKKGKNDRKTKKVVKPKDNGGKTRGSKKSNRDKSRGNKTDTSDDIVLSGKSVSGGRWKLLALRTIIWLFLGLFLALGIKQAFFPSKITAASVTEEVGLSLGINGFPKVEGENIGKRFVSAYLNVVPSDSTERREQLSAYIMGNEEPTWINVDSTQEGKSQIITAGPYLVNQPFLVDAEGIPTAVKCDLIVTPCRAVYIFATQVTDPRAVTSSGEKAKPTWVYLSVPMIASETKEFGVGVAVADAPAFVSAPPGVSVVDPVEITIDEEAVTSLEKDLKNFFSGWAASNTDAIKRYTPDGAIPPPIITAGLKGTVKLEEITDLIVQKNEGANSAVGTPQFAQVRITWMTPTGFTFEQMYTMKVQQTGDKWYILDLQGGGFPATG